MATPSTPGSSAGTPTAAVAGSSSVAAATASAGISVVATPIAAASAAVASPPASTVAASSTVEPASAVASPAVATPVAATSAASSAAASPAGAATGVPPAAGVTVPAAGAEAPASPAGASSATSSPLTPASGTSATHTTPVASALSVAARPAALQPSVGAQPRLGVGDDDIECSSKLGNELEFSSNSGPDDLKKLGTEATKAKDALEGKSEFKNLDVYNAFFYMAEIGTVIGRPIQLALRKVLGFTGIKGDPTSQKSTDDPKATSEASTADSLSFTSEAPAPTATLSDTPAVEFEAAVPEPAPSPVAAPLADVRAQAEGQRQSGGEVALSADAMIPPGDAILPAHDQTCAEDPTLLGRAPIPVVAPTTVEASPAAVAADSEVEHTRPRAGSSM